MKLIKNMNFKIITQDISFLTEYNTLKTAQTLISITKIELENIIFNIQNDTFDFDEYSFAKNSQGLTNIAGIYIIANKISKKIYLGGSVNLAQRRREYKSYLTNNNKKVYKSMQEDLITGQVSDFVFLPIVGFQCSNELGLTNNSKQAINKQLMSFLDRMVEQPLLEEYLSPTSKYAKLFYNTKTVGTFTKGNRYGGSATSGAENKPLMFGNYAWESVSAAAKSLSKDRKSIRIQRDNGKLQEISMEEFQNFNGNNVQNNNAQDYFKDKLQELQAIKRRLGLR